MLLKRCNMSSLTRSSPVPLDKSGQPEVLPRKVVLKVFPKFTGQYLRRSLFLNKVAGCSDPGAHIFL